ncbi:MAG TPA: cytochrome c maturation protein CcmE, partial [Myxococcaceae bacterium]|nr:cytochrome c maturation protein CcmE [Myxococcaceae bacterium]
MKKNTRLVAMAALLVAGTALGGIVLLSGQIGQNLVYYWSPSEVMSNGEKAYGPTIRLGGVVRPGSIQWDPA